MDCGDDGAESVTKEVKREKKKDRRKKKKENRTVKKKQQEREKYLKKIKLLNKVICIIIYN